MKVFLALVIIALMIATVVTLVRGIIQFLKTATDEAHGGPSPSAASIRSNQLMWKRIYYQGVAVLVVVLLLFASKGS